MARIRKTARQKAIDDPCSKYWRNKADKAWRDVIFKISDGKCAICGASDCLLNAHHLIPREIKHLRHCIENGVMACPSHHKYNSKLSAHKSSLMFAVWLSINQPQQWEWVKSQFQLHLAQPNQDTPFNYKEAHERLLKILE